MRRFLSGNVGHTAEVIFSVMGLREKVTGEIVGITENAVVLEVNGDLIAAPIENILFIRVFNDSTNVKESVIESEAQTGGRNQMSETTAVNKSGKKFSPSLNAPGRRTQTILK